ncbi:MAG: biotin--[acetyl-CoA-carboxylase] ligase [Bacteroidales bacterium]|nr:biotin--[acetyl-CoA-carboxylase] ligase [Bacteroidales bacterium]
MKLVYFDTLESTNKYCELLDLAQVEEFTVVAAGSQTAGVGQRGSQWESQPYSNLAFSLVLKPVFLAVAEQYELTKAISVGIADWVKETLGENGEEERQPDMAKEVAIKWPNDIYIGDRKLCGVLVSNHVSDGVLCSSIAGVGLNVNQTTFSDWIPNPVSLSMLTGKTYHLNAALASLVSSICNRYEQLRSGMRHAVDGDYLHDLLRRDREADYYYRGKSLRATLRGVNRFGHLVLTLPNGEELECDMGELKFLF